MCGSAGFWSGAGHGDPAGLVRRMAARIAYRGPDSFGEWIDADAGLALGHRRLSIIDLSPAGHQPMQSRDGRHVISYNGEIYNHPALRRDLEDAGHRGWRGTSDTETLLAAITEWGLDGALERANGMFAFALWDREARALHLARDRMGEKPLYYGRHGQSFLFGSELKALAAHPDWRAEVDRGALALLLRLSYVPSPHCIWQGIRKLPPAHYVTVTDGGRQVSEPVCYWRLEDAVRRGQATRFAGSDAEAANALEALLSDAVGLRMAADVPLGAFLSGGLDSSTVVALMQAQASRPVRTFSIGFHEHGYDEAAHAKAVAEHLGTDHTELYVRPRDALAVIPDLPGMWDEPFADSSQIPTYLVSRLARDHVTVSLSGDGGDELFCGYNRYVLGYDVWRRIGRLPAPLRRGLGAALGRVPPALPDRAMALLPKRLRFPAPGDRLLKLAEVLRHDDAEAFYRALVSHTKDPGALVIGGDEPATALSDRTDWPGVGDFRERMMYLDAKTYLPDDILTKVDLASMAVSLEARVPLLDHRVVDFAQSLPMTMKVRGGQSKWLLRQVLYRHVPQALMDRPKMGFGVPVEEWLRGPLKDWGAALLDETRLGREGFLQPEPVRRMWDEHQAGTRRWHYHLWDVLMFQAWLEADRQAA